MVAWQSHLGWLRFSMVLAVLVWGYLMFAPFEKTVDGVGESCGVGAFYWAPSDPVGNETPHEARTFEQCRGRAYLRVLAGMAVVGLAGYALSKASRIKRGREVGRPPGVPTA